MSARRSALYVLIIFASLLLLGCSEDTAGLAQKIADLEKRMQKQEKDVKEIAGKFSPPKDFSADIQRIEDQQDRMQQAIKTKVDPVNNKLEEFRDWAQEAQKEREEVGKKLKGLEASISEVNKKLEAEARQAGVAAREVPALKKHVAGVSKNVDDLAKGLADVRKEIQENNSKIVNAVKKTLPKLKEAAVAELKDQLTPLEQGLSNLKTGVESDRQAIAAIKTQPQSQTQPQPQPESGKEVQALNKRIKELEEILTTQKAYLLEVGSKVHELELQLRR
jgi:chromosome segregation ATPase